MVDNYNREVQEVSYVKPYLKWPGGKFSLQGKLIPYFEGFNNYVEGMCGSAATSLNVKAKRLILNDTIHEVVHSHRIVSKDPLGLCTICDRLWQQHDKEGDTLYYNIRKQFNELRLDDNLSNHDTLLLSAYLIFLNRFGFNGLYRLNSKGVFNVPVGKHSSKPSIPSAQMTNAYNIWSGKRTSFSNLDYRLLVREIINNPEKWGVRGRVAFYFDPPYFPSEVEKASGFTNYDGMSWSDKEQRELAEFAREIRKAGHRAVITNRLCDKSEIVYSDADTIEVIGTRSNIGADKRSRKYREDILAVYDRSLK